MTSIGEVVYKKSMIFEVFGAYLSEWLIFSKNLPSSCKRNQKFDYGCSSYHGNDAPILEGFFMILEYFELLVLAQTLSLGQ